MDFGANLASSSVKDQSEAAIFLRAEGARGVMHLPAILANIRKIDAEKVLDRFEETLLGTGAMTMGAIVGQIGFDSDDTLHQSIHNCIIDLTSSKNISVAAQAIYGLGNLESNDPKIMETLHKLVISKLRPDEHKHVTIRSLALRMLRRLDPQISAGYNRTPAFDEYRRAVAYWVDSGASGHAETQNELRIELDWLEQQR
jgi:hypothetical protein